MNCNVTIDWKFALACGASVAGTILALKLDSDAAERVSTEVVEACKDCVVAGNSDH